MSEIGLRHPLLYLLCDVDDQGYSEKKKVAHLGIHEGLTAYFHEKRIPNFHKFFLNPSQGCLFFIGFFFKTF